MKTSTKNRKSILAFIFILGLPVLLFTSCVKQATNTYTSTPVAGLAFIQASPDQPSVDLFVNNSRYNTTPIPYGTSYSYLTINAGKIPIAVYNDATMKAIVADTIQFDKNIPYSLFLVNTVSHPQLFVLADTLVKPATGDAGIRFINLSPDAPAVDLVIKDGAALASNMSFKQHSVFSPLLGNTLYTLEVHAAGTSTVLATIPSFKYQAGYVYTIWFHGLAAGTTNSNKLAADVFLNGYFQ